MTPIPLHVSNVLLSVKNAIMQLAPSVLHHIISHLTHVSHVPKVPVNARLLQFCHAVWDTFMILRHTAVENARPIASHAQILLNVWPVVPRSSLTLTPHTAFLVELLNA